MTTVTKQRRSIPLIFYPLLLLTVIGVLISDLALAALDPRIRLQGGTTR